MAQAAASGHELIEGIVVEGVSLEASQWPVAQGVQFGEVHTEVSHVQELWGQSVGPQCTAHHSAVAGIRASNGGCLSPLCIIAATSSSTPTAGLPRPCSLGIPFEDDRSLTVVIPSALVQSWYPSRAETCTPRCLQDAPLWSL